MTWQRLELLQPVEADLDTLLSGSAQPHPGAGHPILQAAAEHLFAAGGKRLRPGIVLLLSRAVAPDGELTPRHRRLAEITEMIHTASLVHDDVVDEAATRRGVDTVHSRFNYRVAVLAGDFLFAQASWHLANLDDLDVVKLLSRVIMDLADGEVKQGLFRYDTTLRELPREELLQNGFADCQQRPGRGGAFLPPPQPPRRSLPLRPPARSGLPGGG